MEILKLKSYNNPTKKVQEQMALLVYSTKHLKKN